MNARELYQRIADDANMPVSTVGKVARLVLIALATAPVAERERLLARYRVVGKQGGRAGV